MITGNINKVISRFLDAGNSVSIADARLINSFTRDPDFPYFVSFPRTGSHWLRMVMEFYFKKPSLVRAFYYKDATDFTCYHTHDINLDLRRENVIYLYRNPVETVYSQLSYHKENPDDDYKRQYWTELYARHLSKWLMHDDFTKKKTVITYEGMKSNMSREIRKISRHLNQEFDPQCLALAEAQVSKAKLKKKTRHDGQVVNMSDSYQAGREIFAARYEQEVLGRLFSVDPGLEACFPGISNQG
jgi:hypothetical protein